MNERTGISTLKGIGEKTAAKLLEQFKSVDNVIEEEDEQGNHLCPLL